MVDQEPDEGVLEDAFAYAQEQTGPKWRARQFLPGSATALADESPCTPAEVLATWPERFQIFEETPTQPGLRRPQVGGIHALIGYWTTDPKMPATVVMPTGTGKTDTMVAALVAQRIEKLLVLVPSDALRDQLATKFERLGVLPALGLVDGDARMPVVGRLFGGLKDQADAERLANVSNVVVSTPSALSHASDEVRRYFLSRFTHLFIDEAHHVMAATWLRLRDEFAPKPVVQFTATPHRTDGQHLGGRLIYTFPLREAQRQGYFSKIRYQSVLDPVSPDEAISKAAVGFLKGDIEAGFDHLLMARVNSIRRAEEIQAIYAKLAPEYSPVMVHHQIGKTKQRLAMDQLANRESRILVCVDMFGEGFDFPQLKVASLHDQHRSLGITLQFIGRFARSGGVDLGPATVVAARTELRHDAALRRLYAEDADWDRIIEDLSSHAIEEQAEIDEFTQSFGNLPDEVSIHSLTPAMSTVVYRPSTLSWSPERVVDVFPEFDLLTYPVPTSERDHVLWFVTQRRASPRWGTVEGVQAVSYDLFVVYWDADNRLLYINSSDNDSVHEDLARAVSGDADIALLTGENVYRVFDQVQRLTPTNVGLLDARNRSRRYTSHVGSDVTEAFPAAEAQTKTQTHIAGTGFLEGGRYSIAGSLKGRVWSHRTAYSLKEWVDWCNIVGPKIIDSSISVDGILAGFIRPQEIDEWPALHALSLEMTSALGEILEQADLSVDSVSVPFHEIEVELGEKVSDSNIELSLKCDEWEAKYVLELTRAGLTVRLAEGAQEASVQRPRSTKDFSALANQYGVRVLMEGDAVVEPPGLLLQPNRILPAWPVERLNPISWDGVDIRAESWGTERNPLTVQGRMIEHVLADDWEVVLDDDGPGEVADIVAIREIDGSILVRLVHCKYSSADEPGGRIGDLYELAGQTQRSAGLRRNFDTLFGRLIRRERARAKKGRSGFVRGSFEDLQRLYEHSIQLRPILSIAMAQPGLSATAASTSQLELLSSVDMYVSETAMSTVEVFCSR